MICDLLSALKQNRTQIMRVEKFLHKLLGNTIHKSRINLLGCVIAAIIRIKELKLTSIGRAIDLPIQERSAIRKIDRLLGNSFFQKQNKIFYEAVTRLLVGCKKRPIIIVDWTKLPNREEYVLRASLAAQGRAITLYEEIHPKKKVGNDKSHRLFLNKLAKLLPEGCNPIMVTDAGFKNPWFRSVLKLGWDYIGRVRCCGITTYKDATGQFMLCNNLFKIARSTPKYLGEMVLAKRNPLLVSFYIVKEKIKGRKKYTKSGKDAVDKDSKNYSRGYREPWLLVSSLKGRFTAKKVVKIYKMRMTIEEAFRDMKSSQYGFSFENNKTIKRERLIVWLMLASLASLLAWIVGFVAERLKLHYQFQANSIRHRRVLSFFYLGCQIIRKKMEMPIDLQQFAFAREIGI